MMSTKAPLALLIPMVACSAGSPSSMDDAPTVNVPVECAARSGERGDFEVELDIREALQTRKYQVYVPSSVSLAEPAPVVLAFHGGGESSLSIELGTGYREKAESEGFILVRPEGVNSVPGASRERRAWNAGICCGFAAAQGVDDVAYVNRLLDDLESRYCIDRRRVYATGISNGSLLTYRLACEASSRIAAVAAVAGPLTDHDFSSCLVPCDTTTQVACLTDCVLEGLPEAFPCRPARPVPILHIHGTMDSHVPFEGGVGRNEVTGTTFPSVEMNMERWRVLNGCTDALRTEFPSSQAGCETYTQCQEGADVAHCTVFDGGHTWPGGDWNHVACHEESPQYDPAACQDYQDLVGPLSSSLDAVAASWDFFARHPMP